MKSLNQMFKSILFLGIVGSSLVYATNVTNHTDTMVDTSTDTTDTTIAPPTTDDKLNPSIKNNLGAVNILDLSGKDAEGMVITNFIIKTLPDAIEGVLYREDGVTAIILDENLTLEEANGLRFDPNEHYVGDATFTYVAVDDYGLIGNEATFTLPIVVDNITVLVPPIIINITPACPPAVDTNLTPDTGIDENVVDGEPCSCEDETFNGIPIFNTVGLMLVVLLTTLIGFFYTKEESY